MSEDEISVTFMATFSKAMTTVDGSWRLHLDLSEDSGEIIAEIAQLRGYRLQVAIIPISDE